MGEARRRQLAGLYNVEKIMREFEQVEPAQAKNPCYSCLLDDREAEATRVGQLEVPERLQAAGGKYINFGVCERCFNLQAMTRAEKNILADLEEVQRAFKTA
jgi:hypothetical protein